MLLIPYSKTDELILEQKLKQSPAYESVEQFVSIYNERIINPNHDDVSATAKEIAETYWNVDLKNRRLIVLSEDEMHLKLLEFILPHLQLAAQLKRIANELLMENRPQDTIVIFKSGRNGDVYVNTLSSEEDEVIYKGAEQIPNALARIATNPFLLDMLNVIDEDTCYFNMTELASLDTEIGQTIGKLLKDKGVTI